MMYREGVRIRRAGKEGQMGWRLLRVKGRMRSC